MGRLLLLFIAVPAVELSLLIEIGRRIGTGWTLGLVVVTGVIGASLARRQGLRALAAVQDQLARGEMPTDSLIDGLLILVAAALLVTPGVVTDACGFALLVPACRRLARRELVRRFERAVRENRVQVDVHQSIRFERGMPPGPGARPPHRIIDVTPPRAGGA